MKLPWQQTTCINLWPGKSGQAACRVVPQDGRVAQFVSRIGRWVSCFSAASSSSGGQPLHALPHPCQDEGVVPQDECK